MLIGLKVLQTTLLTGLLFLDAIFLGYDWPHLTAALVGVLSGSFILIYYRQGVSRWDRVLKIVSSSLGGIFIGAALNHYFKVESIEYFGLMFVFASFLTLTIMHAVLSTAETNADGIVTTIFQRVFNPSSNVIQKETKVITTVATPKDLKEAHTGHIAETIKNETGE